MFEIKKENNITDAKLQIPLLQETLRSFELHIHLSDHNETAQKLNEEIKFFLLTICPKKILVLSCYLIWIGTQHDSHHISPDYSSKMTDLKKCTQQTISHYSSSNYLTYSQI